MSTDDPLKGYRARTEEDDLNENMVRSIRGLSEKGIDYQSISDVIASQDLIHALNSDTILAKLITHVALVIKTNTYAWTVSNEPETLKREHLETRAARLVIAWVESIRQTGVVAEQLIKQQDVDNDN